MSLCLRLSANVSACFRAYARVYVHKRSTCLLCFHVAAFIIDDSGIDSGQSVLFLLKACSPDATTKLSSVRSPYLP